jgi:hypothetical protein
MTQRQPTPVLLTAGDMKEWLLFSITDVYYTSRKQGFLICTALVVLETVLEPAFCEFKTRIRARIETEWADVDEPMPGIICEYEQLKTISRNPELYQRKYQAGS